MRRFLAALGAVLFMVACSPPSGDLLLHGHPVNIQVIDGDESWHNAGRVYIGRAGRNSHEGWVQLVTHELCHAIDYYAGRPSSSWPGDPSVWARDPAERWAEACSLLWRERETTDSFVTPRAKVGVDTGSAPSAGEVTLAYYRDRCGDALTACIGGEP